MSDPFVFIDIPASFRQFLCLQLLLLRFGACPIPALATRSSRPAGSPERAPAPGSQRALPQALRGPVDFRALRRLAAIRAGEETRGLSRDMATPGKRQV